MTKKADFSILDNLSKDLKAKEKENQKRINEAKSLEILRNWKNEQRRRNLLGQ